jgi:hypothetical protein
VSKVRSPVEISVVAFPMNVTVTGLDALDMSPEVPAVGTAMRRYYRD